MVNQPEFDVFLAHNSQDKPLVKAISTELKLRGLKPWIDEEQILPGRPFQDVIQQAIPTVKSAAIFIGQGGLGKWQAMELRILISQCVDADIPVIPVLLPGVGSIPGDLLFLQQFNWVSFGNSIDDVGSLQKLASGINQQLTSSPKTFENFDVFLCYNDEDQLEVKKIAEQLKQRQILPWLDLWEVPPDRSWEELLADQIAHIHSVAVFIGSTGGPWQRQEIESFIWEFVELRRPVIPVILQNVLQELELPIYLGSRSRIRVDFRQDNAEALYNLEWGITQKKPINTPKTNESSSNQETNCCDLLEDLLGAGKWKEADQETKKILLESSGKKEDEGLGVEEIRNFSCQLLSTIDELWVNYSAGHFGFSVQQSIWEKVHSKPLWKKIAKNIEKILTNNEQDNNDKEHWYSFGERVGWYKEKPKKWVQYKDITFNLNAPKGHLPYSRGWWKGMRYQYESERFSALMLRIKFCQK